MSLAPVILRLSWSRHLSMKFMSTNITCIIITSRLSARSEVEWQKKSRSYLRENTLVAPVPMAFRRLERVLTSTLLAPPIPTGFAQ
jgi:hypothetical protein